MKTRSSVDEDEVRAWDLDISRVLPTLSAHKEPVTGCAIMPDGKRVLSASEDRTLKVWDLETGRVLTTLVNKSAARDK